MDAYNVNLFINNSMGIVSAIMLAACLYFTLTYFQYVKQGNERLMKQSKLFAVIALFLAFGLPAIYQFVISNIMFQ